MCLLETIYSSRSKGFVNADGALTFETVATKTRMVRTYGIITAISEGTGIPNTCIHNCNEFTMLNNSAPIRTPKGRHAPK